MRRAGAALLLCLLLCGCSWKDAGDLSAVTAGTISREGQQYQLTAELALPMQIRLCRIQAGIRCGADNGTGD